MAFTLGPIVASAAGDSCTGGNTWISGCASTDGSSVSVEYSETYDRPSTGGGSSSSGNNGGGSGGGSTGGSGSGTCTIVIDDSTDRCLGAVYRPGDSSSGGSSGPSLPASFTVSDILDISPRTPGLHMEPNGWGVLGQPVNFWVDVETHRENGTLLGLPVHVQFTPESVRWDFGDGNAWSTASFGSSWASQGLPELSDTATSHRYIERGTVTVTATVSYSAVVFIAGTSVPVNGAVMATSAGLTFELYEQSTVLTPNP